MEFQDNSVAKEYARWCAEFGGDDPYAGSQTVGVYEVLRAHFLIVDHFSQNSDLEGIGGVGPREPSLLHSALYRQFAGFDGVDKWETQFEVAATLFFGLIKDHPFHDANKRTAFLTLLFHLYKLNRWPTVNQRELENLAVDVANNGLARHARYRELRKTNEDPEVIFVGDYLRRNSRNIDRRYYSVTYRQLHGILKTYGFGLENPRHNHIDVVRYERRRKIFGIAGQKIDTYQKLGQIGFPNWGAIVGKGAIRTVRGVTDLTPEKGIDSQSFFKDADPIPALIQTYHGPLQRLADR